MTLPPPTRAGCDALARPCDRTSCRYHPGGELASCALDEAAAGGLERDEVAVRLGLSADYVAVLEERALRTLARRLHAAGVIDREPLRVLASRRLPLAPYGPDEDDDADEPGDLTPEEAYRRQQARRRGLREPGPDGEIDPFGSEIVRGPR